MMTDFCWTEGRMEKRESSKSEPWEKGGYKTHANVGYCRVRWIAYLWLAACAFLPLRPRYNSVSGGYVVLHDLQGQNTSYNIKPV